MLSSFLYRGIHIELYTYNTLTNNYIFSMWVMPGNLIHIWMCAQDVANLNYAFPKTICLPDNGRKTLFDELHCFTIRQRHNKVCSALCRQGATFRMAKPTCHSSHDWMIFAGKATMWWPKIKWTTCTSEKGGNPNQQVKKNMIQNHTEQAYHTCIKHPYTQVLTGRDQVHTLWATSTERSTHQVTKLRQWTTQRYTTKTYTKRSLTLSTWVPPCCPYVRPGVA